VEADAETERWCRGLWVSLLRSERAPGRATADAIARLHSVLVRWSKQQRPPQLGRPDTRKRW
jgi:hypothetical protein